LRLSRVGSRKIVVDWGALHFGRIANKATPSRWN